MGQQHDLALHVGVVGVVDDDPAVRNSLKFSLEIEGLAVAVYADADDLLKDSDLARFRLSRRRSAVTGLERPRPGGGASRSAAPSAGDPHHQSTFARRDGAGGQGGRADRRKTAVGKRAARQDSRAGGVPDAAERLLTPCARESGIGSSSSRSRRR